MSTEEQWEQCSSCEGAGQIENMNYDSDHDCMFRYDCDCDDAKDFFLCTPCDGEGWVETTDD
jgi:hypothetical protein